MNDKSRTVTAQVARRIVLIQQGVAQITLNGIIYRQIQFKESQVTFGGR